MRLISNTKSARRREVSLLAIIETIGAISCSVWVAVSVNTFVFILLGALVAPLLLLRTQKSTRFGLAVFRPVSKVINAEIVSILNLGFSVVVSFPVSVYFVYRAMSTISEIEFFQSQIGIGIFFLFIGSLLLATVFTILTTTIYGVFVVGVMLLIKVIATAYGILFCLRQTLIAIPKNWYKIAWCTDICTPPELFPGVSQVPEFVNFRVSNYISEALSSTPNPNEFETSGYFSRPVLKPIGVAIFVSYLITVVLITIILYIPAILYRWGLKSTSIIYMPFLYLSEISLADKNPRRVLIAFAKQNVSKNYASLVLTSHVLIPLAFLAFYGHLQFHSINSNILPELLIYFSFFPEIRLVTMTKIANALLVYFSMWFASYSLRTHSFNTPEMTLRVIGIFRSFLTLYSILVLVYIINQNVTVEEAYYIWSQILDTLESIEIDYDLFPKLRSST